MADPDRMVKVYESMHLAQVAAVAARLEEEGIAAEIRNAGLTTDVHFGAMIFATPTVEVPGADAERAGVIVTEMIAHRREMAASRLRLRKKVCPGCGEESPTDFEVCWSCGAALPGETSPSGDGIS